MKFLPLVWAGLWRRPVRSTLTASCKMRGAPPMPMSAHIPTLLHEN